MNYTIESQYNNINGETNNMQGYGDTSETNDYPFLTFLLMMWVKEYAQEVRVNQIDQKYFKIHISKKVGYENLFSFKNIFEQLAYSNLKIIDNDLLDEWIINYQIKN